MSTWFFILWCTVILQRLFELKIAERNAMWMKEQGGYEVGKAHYPWIIFIHILFFSGIAIECFALDAKPPSVWPVLFLLFVILQGLRIWCIRSLGKFWNTRIFILPGHRLRSGVYRYLRHPNYLIVMVEMVLFPLLYGAYVTAVILPIVNGLFLYFIRIPIEEQALGITSS